MSGLQNFLAPFSHLLFANRNVDIVVLCFILFAVAVYALQNHWRAASLERQLTDSRSNVSTAPAGRRYASAPVVEESIPEPGGLPPVKGGRTYARNLGSALQKAGMSAPPIYSPPTPAGFAPNTNAMQPMVGQPNVGQPYAPPGAPWAAPAPAPAPWAFPAGAGRNTPGQGPAPSPFYQPQPAGSHGQPPMSSPAAPPLGSPGGYGSPQPAGGFPPQSNGPFGAPPFGVPGPGPASPPAFAPPGAGPMMPPAGAPGPMMPGPMMPGQPVAGLGQPAAQPQPADGGRRGKPKRRRFNFNVLENIEKMVQARPSEPAPTTGWVPPAPVVAPPAPPTTGPVPIAATSSQPSSTPIAQPDASGKSTVESAPTLPFLFGDRPETPSEKTVEPIAAEPPPVKEAASEEPMVPEPVMEEAPETEPTAAASSTADRPKTEDSTPSMRSMMFGEEITAGVDAQSAAIEPQLSAPSEETSEATVDQPAGTTSEAEVDVADATRGDTASSWPPYPWEKREEGSTAIEPAPQEAADATSDVSEKEAESEAWKPADDSEPWTFQSQADMTPDAEPALVEAADAEPRNQIEETSANDDGATLATAGAKPGAGTLVIIEDDQTAASYYETLFKGNGYQVEVANDGVSGVDLCARVQPQVILLDVMMPRQNGILVLQTLRASDETKDTPVVVMSNFSEPTLIKRALQLGALEYVIKTQVEGPALLNAVPRWMNREKAFAGT